jgi:hypothetical protein
MAINASSGGQLQGGTNGPGSGGGLTEEDVQDIVASQIEVGTDISIGLQTSYDDATGKLMISLAGGGLGGGSGSPGSISIKEDGTARGTATVLNFVGPGVDVVNNVATITGGLDSVSIYENTSNRGNFTSLNFVSGASVNVVDGVANVTVIGSSFSGSYNDLTNKPVLFSGSYSDLTNKPALFSGSYADLTNKPTLVTSYSQLTDQPTIPSLAGYATESYVNQQLSSLNLEDLTDTYVTGVTDGQALVWSQSNLRWQPGDIGSGGGGGNYTLPTASTSVLGGVKVDGTTITISDGVISAVGGGSGGGVTLNDVGTYLNNNGYATQTYVQGQVTNLINGAPGALNTLNELATALNNDASFATTITNSLASKVNLSGGTMTGALTLSGAPTADLQAATKKYVDDSIALIPTPSTNLDALTDVDTTGVTSGQLLGWNGTSWVPVANSGAKGDTGPAGAKGDTGTAGLSISAATVTLAGRLQLTLSDNTVVDAGNVSGIKSAAVNGSGELILTKQDNSTVNAGNVIGPQGATGATGPQGIQGETGAQGPAGLAVTGAAVNVSGRLIITRSDSSIIDAGLVIGPQGAQGVKGDTGETGAVGPAGTNGTNGVGVSSATVDGTGRLIITKTDSTTVDAGSVVGPKGDQGATGNTGAPGAKGDRGISVAQAVVDNGNLIITLDDASQLDAGNVIGAQGPQGVQGPAGRSVADSGVVVDAGGYLQVTLTDGTTVNAGYVVGPQGSTGATGATGAQGPKGDTGATGEKGDIGTSYTVNGTSGSVQVYGLGNTTQPGYDLEVDLANRANKWTTARTFTLSGKVTGLTSFDGSGNITMTTALNAVSTSDISEGTRLYYTDARARTALSSISDSNITSLISYDDVTGQIKYRANTSYITEGSNLYFTNTRADARADTRIAASSINALSDVDTATTAPTNGQVLTWTGSAWTPSSVAGGSGDVSSVNAKTGIVVLNTDDVSEGSTNQYFTNTRWDNRLAAKTTDNLNQGTTNKYFTDTLARNALAAGTGLSYNSASGTFSLSASTSNVTEGTNLYFTNARFDTRLGQSNLNAFADVTNTTPTTGQALAWNGSAWAPTTISSGGGGGGGSGTSTLFKATVQVEYDASGALTGVNVLNGGISATVVTATSTVCTVSFTLTGATSVPLNTQVYGYNRTANSYVTTGVTPSFNVTGGRNVAGGGSSGTPTAFSAFDPAVNTVTLGLTKTISGATAGVGQTTHCVVVFLLSSE